MTNQIMLISEIVDDARQSAEAGKSSATCPYLDGTERADRWLLAFYAREQEIRAEVEG